MIVRAYEEGDEKKLNFDSSQDYMNKFLKTDNFDLKPMVEQNLVWTAEHQNKTAAMGGIVPIWDNRALAWMWMGDISGRHMIGIHRAVKQFLDETSFKRIEATVDVGFKPGMRWMKMLGFEMEGYLRAYRPDGRDMIMFSRIKP